LRQDFPKLSNHKIDNIISDFNTSHYRVDGSGQVQLFLQSQLEPLKISAPVLRRDAYFGKQVGLSDDKVIICDQWHEGYQFLLFPGAWELERKANELCDGSILALIDDWVIKARGPQITFYQDESNEFKRQAVRDITQDFGGLYEGSFVQNVRVHGDLLVAKVRNRSAYFLSIYQLRSGQWQPVSLTEAPNFFTDFDVFDRQVFQLHQNEVLVYHFDGEKLQLKYRYPILEKDNLNTPNFMLVTRDESGEKLVIDANRELHQIRLH